MFLFILYASSCCSNPKEHLVKFSGTVQLKFIVSSTGIQFQNCQTCGVKSLETRNFEVYFLCMRYYKCEIHATSFVILLGYAVYHVIFLLLSGAYIISVYRRSSVVLMMKVNLVLISLFINLSHSGLAPFLAI